MTKTFLLYTLIERLLRPVFGLVYRIRIEGGEHIPASGPVILAANHVSVMDGFFLAFATRRQARFMAKAELYRLPLLGQFMYAVGAFPVDRDGDRGRAVARGVALLDEGYLIGLFPEGTCLPDKKNGYRRGAARLAIASGAPLVPVGLVGTEKTLVPYTHRVGFPRVRIVIGPPIAVPRGEPTEEAATALTAELEAAIVALVEQGRATG